MALVAEPQQLGCVLLQDQRAHLVGRPAAECRDPGERERLAEDRGQLQRGALERLQAVQAGCDEGVQRLGDVEIADVAGEDVARALLGE